MLQSIARRCAQCLLALLLMICYLALRYHRTVTATQPIPAQGDLVMYEQASPAPGKKTPSYAKNARHHRVTFFVRKDETSSEMIPRQGMLTLRKKPKGTILLCHGYLCNKTDIAFLRTLFPDYNCMVFDFRAHGDWRENQWCTLGKHEAYDVIAAANCLRTHPETRDTKLFGYGFSMGAVSLIEAQAKSPVFDALILDCPFDSSHNVLDRVLGNLNLDLWGWKFEMPGRALIQKYAFHPYVEPLIRSLIKTIAYSETVDINTQLASLHPARSIEQITVPCYFIHCKQDEKVPTEAARRLYEGARGFKRLWLTDGRRHFDSYFAQPEKYTHRVNKFLTSVLSGTYNTQASAKILEDQEQ